MAVTIMLGAVGSGLWDLVLRDAFFAVGNIALTLVASVWSGYVDLLHDEIGAMREDGLVVPVFASVLALLLLAPWGLFLGTLESIGSRRRRLENIEKQRRENVAERESATKERAELVREVEELSAKLDREIGDVSAHLDSYRRQMIRLQLPTALIATIILALFTWQLMYTRTAANWADRSIEILRPHVSEKEHWEMRASLRSVESAAQFYDFEDLVRNHARQAAVELPSFESIGR